MVCYVKVFQGHIHEKHSEFLLNKFSFGGWFDLKEGDEKPITAKKINDKDYKRMIWRKACYKSMEIYLGYKYDELTKAIYWNLELRGSLHKYACNGSNSSLFTAYQAMDAFDKLCKETRLDKSKARFHNFELGVNIKPTLNYTAIKYCELYLLRYKTFPFVWMKTNIKNEKIGKVAELSHRQIKFYCKDEKTLRFEIHWSDMQELRDKYNLGTINNLTEELIIKMACELIPGTFVDVVSLNGINLNDVSLKTFSVRDRTILKDHVNECYIVHQNETIQNLLFTSKNVQWESLRKSFKRQRDRFLLLVNKHGDKSNESILQKIVEAIQCSYNVSHS